MKKILTDDPRVRKALRLRDEGMGYVRAGQMAGLSDTVMRRVLVETGRDPQKHWRGEGAPNWKGGWRTDDGYIRVSLGWRKSILEHRLVMERYLGRSLEPYETVHHKNGIRDDNRIENLQLRNGKHGKGQVLRCADCGSTHIVPSTIE